MSTLADIERLTQTYAAARDGLGDLLRALEGEVADAHRRYLPGIKKALARAAEAHDRLGAAVEANPELFVRPRTVLFHGVKVGLAKGKGVLTWADADQVVRLIQKHLPDRMEVLVKTVQTPVKAALEQLSASELKRLGVQVEESGDQVVIKAMDGAVEKLVKALEKDALRTLDAARDAA